MEICHYCAFINGIINIIENIEVVMHVILSYFFNTRKINCTKNLRRTSINSAQEEKAITCLTQYPSPTPSADTFSNYFQAMTLTCWAPAGNHNLFALFPSWTHDTYFISVQHIVVSD